MVFEVATLLGIELFGTDRERLRGIVERGRDRLAFLRPRANRLRHLQGSASERNALVD
jgi:hypothetical protein